MELSIKEKQQFSLHCLASSAFSTVIKTCKEIIERPILETDSIYYPLTVSVFVTYGSPFTKNWGFGKLDAEQLIPEKDMSLHNEVIVYRDKLYAHTDKGVEHEDFGPVNEIRATISRGRCRFWSQPIRPTHIRIVEILHLSEFLLEKMEYRKEKFVKKHKKLIRHPEGEYLLDTSNNDQLLIPRDQEQVKKEKMFFNEIRKSHGTFKPEPK